MSKSSEIVQKIQDHVELYDLVLSYLPLKKSGNYYKALCPFHDEKTPSFYVFPNTQTYHCFGCNKGGSIINFIMEIEKVNFIEAINILAHRYNIQIKINKQEYNNNNTMKDRLYKIYTLASKWYHDNLYKDTNKKVLEYLQNRKITTEMINKFLIGYAPDSWSSLIKYLKDNEFTEDEILNAKLAMYSETSKRIYNFFRGRLMLPIWNENGQIIAFSARTLENKSENKYINSPETIIFKKRNTLYGLNFSKFEIQKKEFAILCEGQLDLISILQSGYHNAIAIQGTAFTENQAKVLKKFTNSVYLCFDNDKAGIKAIKNTINILLQEEFKTIKVIQLPNNKDPNTLIIENNNAIIEKSIEYSLEYYIYIFNHITENKDLYNPVDKVETLHQMFDFLIKIKNKILRNQYISMLANKLQLKEYEVFEEFNIFNDRKNKNNDLSIKTKNSIIQSITKRTTEEELLFILIKNIDKKELLKKAVSNFNIDKFIDDSSSISKTLKKCILSIRDNNISNNNNLLINDYNVILSECSFLNKKLNHEEIITIVNDCIKKIKIKYINKLVDVIEEKFIEEKFIEKRKILVMQVNRLKMFKKNKLLYIQK